jgi:hypothetical protein
MQAEAQKFNHYLHLCPKELIAMAAQNHAQLNQQGSVDHVRLTRNVDRERQPSERAEDFDWQASRRDGNGSDQTSEIVEPPSKRKRVALACSVCRARKSKVSLFHAREPANIIQSVVNYL